MNPRDHQKSRSDRAGRSPKRAFLLLAAPIALALLLCIPGFRFPFLFDDFELLARAQSPVWTRFLPDPSTLFYRPVSREGYFGLILALGGRGGALMGHLLNFALVGVGIILMWAVGSRLLGRKAGYIAAFSFAAFSQVPVLVAWVSGCQDLLAIDFLLLAFLFALKDRHALALGAAGIALLSKETAAALFPVVALAGWILGRSSRPTKGVLLSYVGVFVAWTLFHPGLRLLSAGKFVRTQAGYLGLDNPERWNSLVGSGATLFNLPLPGSHPAWPFHLTLPALGAIAIALATWALALRGEEPSPEESFPRWRVALLGSAMTLPPLILTSLIVRHWAPYYVAIPAIGACVLLATLLQGASRWAVAIALSVFISLGVWERGMRIDPEIPTEANLYPVARALETAEGQFRKLVPSFPDSARVLVSVLARGERSVRVHMYRYQVLRWWYGNPTLEVTRPELRTQPTRPEYLFWIGQDLTVYQVDLNTLLPRSVGRAADYIDYQKTMRAYARGLADSGQLGKAVWILLQMPEVRAEYRNLDHRIAAMLLLQHGYEQDAERVLAGLPHISRRDALELVPVLLETPARSELLVDTAMRAFGLSPGDADTLRALLATLVAHHAYPQMRQVAQRLLTLRPDDPQAKAVIKEAERARPVDLLIAPAP